jgi:phosphohistidine phosphatase
MRDLFLIRHAPADTSEPEGSGDARPLTPVGRKRFRRAVRGMDRLGIRFDRLYHSPLLRAAETAELCRSLLDGESVVAPGLAGSPDEALLQSIDGESVALVGHQPWLSELLAWLVFGSPDRAPKVVLKKGGVAWLRGDFAPGGMALHALFRPRSLRAVASR